MSWNYRVVKTPEKHPLDDLSTHYYSIEEVYYDLKGEPSGRCNASVGNWESLEDLRRTLLQMLLAIDKPVLDADTDFNGDLFIDTDGRLNVLDKLETP